MLKICLLVDESPALRNDCDFVGYVAYKNKYMFELIELITFANYAQNCRIRNN